MINIIPARVFKNGESVNEAATRLGLNPEVVLGNIEYLSSYDNNPISVIEENGELYIQKIRRQSSTKFLKPSIDDLEQMNKTELLVYSDTHLCNKDQQLWMVNELYKMANDRGITTALHIGDVVDGDYTSIRKEQIYKLFARGFKEQCDYVIEFMPKVKGMTTYFIQGSHDETHLKNGGGILGEVVSKARKDFIYKGQDRATIKINNIKICLDHPGGGSAKILSYKPQGTVETFESGAKPNLLLQGHYHKSYYMMYRNIHTILVPSTTSQSQFMMKKGISNIMGGYILTIYSNKKGEIEYMLPEEILFNEEQVKENDYIKTKQLVIR